MKESHKVDDINPIDILSENSSNKSNQNGQNLRVWIKPPRKGSISSKNQTSNQYPENPLNLYKYSEQSSSKTRKAIST